MEKNEIIKVVKGWIIDILDDTTKKNFNHNLGVVDGMERVLNFTQDYNTDKNEDIQNAYKRLNDRIFDKKED